MAKKKETIQPTEDTIKKNPEAANVKSNEDTTQKIADLTAEKETLQAENKKQAEEIQELCQMLQPSADGQIKLISLGFGGLIRNNDEIFRSVFICKHLAEFLNFFSLFFILL